MMGQWVEIEFDCLPLRSINRLDVPVDASPVYEQFVLRVKAAMQSTARTTPTTCTAARAPFT